MIDNLKKPINEDVLKDLLENPGYAMLILMALLAKYDPDSFDNVVKSLTSNIIDKEDYCD